MKAVTYQALGEVQNSEIADPVPTSDEIVVRVNASGICHTDIDILHGHYGNSTFQIVPGHEYAGGNYCIRGRSHSLFTRQ